MPFVPLPFVVALLLAILLVAMARREDTTPASRPFLTLITVCAVQSVLAGLRWGYGVDGVRFATPVLAATIPPLVHACFTALSQDRSHRGWFSAWRHGLPAGLVAALTIWRPALIDPVLIILYLGYAAALLRLARSGPDALCLARLDGAVPAHRALRLAAAALIASALVDTIILLDFEWTQGTHAAAVIGIANLLGLIALGLCAAIAGRTRAPADPPEPVDTAPRPDTEADGEIVARIDALMRTQRLFRNPNLSLDRLARKAGLPARRISTAINRVTGKNVSQYVNDHRVREACRLLAETDQPVTAIMFEAGFQTKSNFNREFRRITGTTPVAWRAAGDQPLPGTP